MYIILVLRCCDCLFKAVYSIGSCGSLVFPHIQMSSHSLDCEFIVLKCADNVLLESDSPYNNDQGRTQGVSEVSGNPLCES